MHIEMSVERGSTIIYNSLKIKDQFISEELSEFREHFAKRVETSLKTKMTTNLNVKQN